MHCRQMTSNPRASCQSDIKAEDVAKDTELNHNDEANVMPSAEQEVITSSFRWRYC